MSTPRERPILFSGPMVRAILDGRKTQTRRAVRPMAGRQSKWLSMEDLHTFVERGEMSGDGWQMWHPKGGDRSPLGWIRSPFGMPGDRLWVVTVKDIPGHEGRYGAGDDGHIYRTDRPEPRPLRTHNANGYRRVSLSLGSKRAQRMVCTHELVCTAFYGPRPSPRHEVRHVDGDRANNLPENLDWGTPEQNWTDRKAHGRGVHEEHHNAKLIMAIAEEMRASGMSAWRLAKKYRVSPKTVANVLSGRTWVRSEAPPRNMPRWASRITLEVTGVRVERLQSISDADARAEGVEANDDDGVTYYGPLGAGHALARVAFQHLWESAYGGAPWRCWDDNPWVWVVEFRRLP